MNKTYVIANGESLHGLEQDELQNGPNMGYVRFGLGVDWMILPSYSDDSLRWYTVSVWSG